MQYIFDTIVQFIYSFIAIIGFCVLFNSPRRLNLMTALSGALAWILYNLLHSLSLPFILPYVVGSFVVGFFAEIFARKYKHPAIIFTIPALIPFVPGYGIYYTMLYIIEQQYDAAIQSGAEALFIAIAIASGVIVATSFARILFKK